MSDRPASLEGLHAGVTRLLDRRLRWIGALLGALVVALLLVLAWLMVPTGPREARSALPLILDLAGVAALVALGAGWWRTRRRLLDEAQVAARMEEVAGVSPGLVLGGLELGRARPAGVSEPLLEQARSRLAARLDLPLDRLAGAAGERLRKAVVRGSGALAVLIPVVVLLALGAPERTRAAWSDLGSPLTRLTGPTLPPLAVDPGDTEVVRGSAVVVEVAAVGRESVTLRWQRAGDVEQTAVLPVVRDRVDHTFPAVDGTLIYRVDAPDGAGAGDFTITPLDPLLVTDVAARLTFPAHTGRPPEEYRGDLPPLRLPAGTELLVEGRGSRALGEARLVPIVLDSLGREVETGGPAIELAVDGAHFRAEWVPTVAGVWGWRFEDAAGRAAELKPAPIELTLAVDAAPTIAITHPARDTVLPLDLRQPLEVHASDDHGVARVELVAWRVNALGEVRAPVRQPLEVAEAQSLVVRPVMDLSNWGLLPGDEVRYYARVVDNGFIPQEASTEEFRLRMPDASELRRAAGGEIDRAADELEELADQAAQAVEAARNLERRMQAPDRDAPERSAAGGEVGDPLDFAAREEVMAALEEQRAMAAQVDTLAERLDRLSTALSDAGAQDDALRRDLAQMRDALAAMGEEAMRQRLDELAAQVGEMDRQAAREALEQLTAEGEDVRDQLEEALERMKQLGARQDFRVTTREAEELAERQHALAESMLDEASAQRAEQQDELRAEAEAMDSRMESLAERLRAMGEEAAAAGVEQARDDTREAVRQMDEAAREAREGDASRAHAEGSQAADEMRQAAGEMAAAEEQMMQDRADALQAALEQTSQDALSLARRQAELRAQMEGATPDQLASLRPAAASVQQGLRNMAENLDMAALASEGGGGERPVMTALGQAMSSVEEGLVALDAPSGRTRSPQVTADQAVDALNRVALESLTAARQLSQGGEGASAEMSTSEQLEQLAQQQAEVNNQTSQMVPMELTPQAQQLQLQELAEQQQQVASNVEQLARKEAEGASPSALDEMAAEAEALARELAGGRLDAATRDRQEQLFHRLLDAGRSLEREEFSDEREGTAAGFVARGDVAPLDAEALGLLRFRPDPGALSRLPPAARALVLQYFDRLNGQGSGEPEPAGAAPGRPGGGAGGGS